MRYCFKNDGEGHNFLIPVDLSNDFDKSLEDGEADWYADFNNRFEQYSCDSVCNWSFENPKGVYEE